MITRLLERLCPHMLFSTVWLFVLVAAFAYLASVIGIFLTVCLFVGALSFLAGEEKSTKS